MTKEICPGDFSCLPKNVNEEICKQIVAKAKGRKKKPRLQAGAGVRQYGPYGSGNLFNMNKSLNVNKQCLYILG